MNVTTDPLAEVLNRHGISDAETYLDEKGRTAGVSTSPDPDVVVRGSVQLMKKCLITREDVARGFSRLRFL